MTTITIGKKGFEVPVGYRHVLWAEVAVNQEVHIVGTHNGEPRAYGPLLVKDKQRRVLVNPKNGRTCVELPESLLVKN